MVCIQYHVRSASVHCVCATYSSLAKARGGYHANYSTMQYCTTQHIHTILVSQRKTYDEWCVGICQYRLYAREAYTELGKYSTYIRIVIHNIVMLS